MKTIRNRPSLASLGGSDPPDALFSAHKKMVMNYPVTILPLLAYATCISLCKNFCDVQKKCRPNGGWCACVLCV